MRVPTLLLALGFVAASHALTFTSPLPGSTVDLTAPLKITWIPSSSDPSTFTLSIINTLSGSSDEPQTLGTNIPTSSTSYILPANTISSYGDGFELLAATSGGDSLAYSGAFSLADGGVYTLQTASDGVLTLVTSSTQGSGPSSTAAPSAAVTSSSGSTAVSSSVESGGSSSESAGTTASATAASPESSSARPSSTATPSSGASASSRTSSAAATSSTSDSSSNLGFDSAASTVKGSVVVSYAAFVGALAFALLAY